MLHYISYGFLFLRSFICSVCFFLDFRLRKGLFLLSFVTGISIDGLQKTKPLHTSLFCFLILCVFHFLPLNLFFISMRVSGCYPRFNFLASIFLEKPKKKHENLNAFCPRTSMHLRQESPEYDARILPNRLTCCTLVYCLCSLLRIVYVFRCTFLLDLKHQ